MREAKKGQKVFKRAGNRHYVKKIEKSPKPGEINLLRPIIFEGTRYIDKGRLIPNIKGCKNTLREMKEFLNFF
ncbi:hypothetical protein DRQ18_01910 [bacterium]|nr:MAG: hypothetical protein DRQ18_01910 [bacterium]